MQQFFTNGGTQAYVVRTPMHAPGGIPSQSGPAAVVYVTAVTVDAVGGNTQIAWDRALPASLAGSDVCIYIFRAKGALYEANSPKPGMFTTSVLANIPGWPSGATVGPNSDWGWEYGEGQTVNLDNA